MWNFAVMKTMFQTFWVGKTKLEANGTSIFSTWDEAVEAAMELNDSIDNLHDLQDALEDEAEEIAPAMEKWII